MTINDSHIFLVAKGDRSSLELLYKELYDRLFFYVFRLTRDKELSEDIIQESFMLYWGKKEQFSSILAVKTFLYITLKNKVMVELRKDSNRKRILESIEWETTYRDNDELVSAEVCGQVQNAIKNLPNQTRKIIELSMLDMSIDEIASELNISSNSVKTLKKAAYKILREKLGHLRYFLFFLLS